MIETGKKLSMPARLLLIAIGTMTVMLFVGTQFQVSSQGDSSSTYPKGFRGGTCTIESEALLVGYSAYFIPANYAVPEDAISAMSVPVLCGKVPKPGSSEYHLSALPDSARHWPLALQPGQDWRRNISKRTFSHPTHDP